MGFTAGSLKNPAAIVGGTSVATIFTLVLLPSLLQFGAGSIRQRGKAGTTTTNCAAAPAE